MRLSRSIVGPEEQAAVRRILALGFLGTGPETQALERELAEYLGGGVEVACVNTGTAALHLALQACGLGADDEVLVPSLTFVASFQAIAATGATPVACDINPENGLLDLADAARRLTPRTRAVMPVHYASHCGDLDKILAFGKRHGLRVIEDAAHSFGCTYQGSKVGTLGDVACFSFDGIKNITCGEGGAVVSRDPEVMRRVRDARLLGVERDTENRYQRQRSWDFDVTEQGWRYHMSDIMAAIGRVQLRRLEGEFKPRRVRSARLYREQLANVPGVRFLATNLEAVVPHIQPVLILDGRRDAVRQTLMEAGIETGIHYKPNHLLKKFGGGTVSLPAVEQIYCQLLTLPRHPDITDQDVEQVVLHLRRAVGHVAATVA